jgi:dipeptidyl aminopeptidase/acylaminoacyl peptidase
MNKPQELATKKPTVLFLHGGFSFGEADWDMAKPYRDSGFIVLIPILRGENGQPGYFSMFYDEVDDVIAAAKFLREQPFVDKSHMYLAGHSAGGTITLLTVEASKLFRAAASFDGSPDQQLLFGVTGSARRAWVPKEVVFDHRILDELRVRSPLAFAKSIKCPVRLYYSTEAAFLYSRSSIRSAEIAKSQNKDVAAIQVEGSHLSHVEPAILQSITFFHALETKK